MKKLVCVLMAAALLFTLGACGQKTDAQNGGIQFTDLQLGAEKQEIVSTLGEDYISSGTTPDRLYYYNLRLFDFIGASESTKLVINLNTEDKAYAYSYYMYDNLESNYKKVKSQLENLFGAASEGENESETWVVGDKTYFLFNQDDYVAVGVN